MNAPFYTLLLAALPALILLHLVVSPYTKVEESFNIQAIHDALAAGLPADLQHVGDFLSQHYDHFAFPGAVPRTFVGALSLAGATAPLKSVLGSAFMTGPQGQMLGTSIYLNNMTANPKQLTGHLVHAIKHAFGTVASTWYLLLQGTQFHVLYYASRTLPNSFAFALTTLALRFFVVAPFGRAKRYRRSRVALGLVTFAGVVFRSELALLVAAMSGTLLFYDMGSLRAAILPAGILAASLGLLVTVTVDSFMWQTFPLWPEWVAFRFNTLEGRSSEWGVQPWHFYLSSALPRLMLNPLALPVCIPAALAVHTTRPFSIRLLAPLLVFIAAYSALPHKEWRFVVYVVPGLTGVAAAGASWIWTRRAKTWFYRVLALALVASVPLSGLASLGLLLVSSLNYPGGEALRALHGAADAAGVRGAKVFLDNLTCQTGATRFLQRDIASGWSYDKTEDEQTLADPAFWARFDYILAENPSKYPGEWDVVTQVYAYGGLSLIEGKSIWRVFAPDVLSAATLLELVEQAENWAKSRLTGGRWPGIRMEPRISILQRRRP